MKILRTPDNCFEGLVDYPFAPHYTTIKTEDGSDLRIHHLDEGAANAPIVLCMHGQPVWSYLYRKMIPLLVADGFRVIAPDLPGYGKSDKPAAREDYSYNLQVDWMNAWLRSNDFGGITFFGQDWGGLIGLRMIADNEDRFDRVVISNTGLPYNPDTPADVIAEVDDFRNNKPTPTLPQMMKAIRAGARAQAIAFAYWQKFCWETPDLPAGFMLSMTTEQRNPLSAAVDFLFYRVGLSTVSPVRTAVAKAYEAPFPDPSYKMGIRAMPSQVPTMSTSPSLDAQGKAWEFFSQWQKPFLCAFADDDPVTGGGDQPFLDKVPGAQGQPHTTIKGGGHFVQEGNPQQLCQVIGDFVRANPTAAA